MFRTVGRFAALLLATLSCALLCAQVDYSAATLKGTIVDPQALVVAGARVTVTNPSRGWSRRVETGEDGMYRIPLLPPGSYRLQVQAAGFATVSAGIVVTVGEVVTYNVHLQLGSARETVEVQEQVPLLQVEQTQQANTVGRRQTAESPTFTHVFTDFLFTLPGVSSSEAPRAQTPGFSGLQSTGFSIGGSNGRSNLITIDGGENDLGTGQLRTPHVPIDSVQEFQVNRSSFAAEFGFTAGTAVNIVTRSGDNQVHGSAHAYFRDKHTAATNYFAPRAGEKAFEQDFATGLTIGGPLVRNRLFVFTAYEFTKTDTPQFRSYSNMQAAKGIRSNPAQLEYVTALATASDPVLQVTAARLQFLLDPANFPNTAKLLAPNTGVFNDWTKNHNWITRFDLQPTANDSVTARFSFLHDDGSRMWVLDPSNAPDDATLAFWRDYTLLTSWSHVFTPRLINQLRVQVVPRNVVDTTVVSPHSAYIRISGLGQFGGEHYSPAYIRQRRFQFEDSLTITSSKHTIKFGGSYRPFTYFVHNELLFGGDVQFRDGAIPIVGGLIPPSSPSYPALANFNLARGLPASGDPATHLTALQTFDLGMPVAYLQAFGNPETSGWEHYFGAYAQDSWKVLRTLTVDFGGRVDLDVPASPLHRNIYFSPRLGFAWNPGKNGKTVIRGGGGIFVAPIPFYVAYVPNLMDDTGQHISYFATALGADTRILALWAMLSGCNPGQPYVCTKEPPFRQLQAADLNAVGFTIGPGQPGRIVAGILEPYKNNYSIQASLSVQRALSGNLGLEVAYLMYHSLHLQVPMDPNLRETGVIDAFAGPLYTRIDPTLTRRTTSAAIGGSIYHGLLVSLTRRFARGMQFQANYTFSKALDDITDFNSEFNVFRPTRFNLERSVSTFNVKHNFVAHAVYVTPFQPGNSFLSRVLADMTLSPILYLRTGIPFTVRVPGLMNGTVGGSIWARPWHAGRNTGVGPNFYSLDMRLTKSFYLQRDAGRKFESFVQVANLLNHTNFSAVNDFFPANPNPFQLGGQTINLLNGPYDFRGIPGLDPSQPLGFKAAFNPRRVQFGLRLIF